MSGYHEAHLSHDPARRVVWEAIADYVSRWIAPDGATLEIGAGYCDWINAVRSRRRVAVDLWDGFVSHAGSGVTPLVLDASSALHTLGTDEFDTVLASNVLEHFEPSTAAGVVHNVRSVLKPGGRFIVVQPNFRYAHRSYFDDYTHRSIFTDVSLPALMRSAGFAIEHVEAKFLPYSLQRSPLKPRGWLVRAYLRSPVRPRAGQMLVVARREDSRAR